ncbi:hypothetical protein [Lysobacter sp. F6437]|uniref:hypothetical protein n=1 Tax=Lysobacter sp. F6437 TaxID=3459296 RepID=UPI00403E12DA
MPVSLLFRSIRRFGLPLLAALVLAGAGCAAPSPGNDRAAPVESVPTPAAPDNGVEINRSCSTDAECTVKDVGNCCGHYPACVNVDSPTDPEGVKAQCAKSGMASVCGFPAITSCQCVAGECKGSNKALLE